MRKKVQVFLVFLICLILSGSVSAAQGTENFWGMDMGWEESFYPKPKETYKIIFYNAKGKELETVSVEKGQELEMIRMADTNKGTMLGWSLSSGKTLAPAYLVAETITPKSDMKLYPVVFPKSSEPDRTDALFGVKKTGYSQVIFVGDSRTKYMGLALKGMSEENAASILENISFVAKGGSGYSWLSGTAMETLEQMLQQCEGKTAVIFNHGVNDLTHINKYIRFYKEQESLLKQYNADGYILSVNPVNKLMEPNPSAKPSRTEKNVLYFNSEIQRRLCAKTDYTYIDTFHFLMRNGFSFNDGSDPYGYHDYDDGVHYSAKTGKRIFLYVMRFLRNR